MSQRRQHQSFDLRSTRKGGVVRREVASPTTTSNYFLRRSNQRSVESEQSQKTSPRQHSQMSNEMSHQQQQQIDNGDSPDFAVEVEVDIVDEVRDEQHRQCQIESPQQQRVVVVSNSISNRTSAGGIVSAAAKQLSSSDGAPGRRTGASRGRAAASQYTIQQLIRFDPMQCFDIEELRNRMVEAQRRIADSASMHLNYNKFKNDNAQLREELASCDHRIALLEATVAERNERLKELLKENIFMRAQYKKIQNEFGVDAVKEVFNRLAR